MKHGQAVPCRPKIEELKEALKKIEDFNKCFEDIIKEIRTLIPSDCQHTYEKAQANSYQTCLNIIRTHRSKV